jgi:hypothetical protein
LHAQKVKEKLKSQIPEKTLVKKRYLPKYLWLYGCIASTMGREKSHHGGSTWQRQNSNPGM